MAFHVSILPSETLGLVGSLERSRPLTLHGARGSDDDGVAATREDCSSGYRRCRCRRESERRVDDEGHEAEESPSHKGAMRARGEEALEVQGVQRLSARS